MNQKSDLKDVTDDLRNKAYHSACGASTSTTTGHNWSGAARDIPPEDEGPFSHSEKARCDGPPKIQPFEFHHCAHALPCLETFDFIENLLVDGGLSVLYSPPNLGKTFFVLDLSAHVAEGRTYRDSMEVDQGAVLYMTLEGGKLFQNRLAAMRQDGRLSHQAPLFYTTVCFDLMSASDPLRLIQTVKDIEAQHSVQFRLIVVDTLARAMPEGDENMTKDMNLVVRRCDEVRAATGAHVLAVHHTGKDATRGSRGASSLRGGVDTELELTAGEEGTVVATVMKQRDLAYCDPMVFSLRSVKLGINARGKQVTSCVVDHHPELAAPAKQGQQFSKTKPPPDTAAVLELLPLSGTVRKRTFLTDGPKKIGAAVRDFESAVERLIADGKIEPSKVKNKSGQWEGHIGRK
jgi:hypothetical protein